MARSRNIKPGFFTNDLLCEVAPLGRLLFSGLWTIADREGRLEDRPKKIKAQVLPYDECNIDSLLHDLNIRGFIIRYSVGSGNYIQIVNWEKHQQPHVKETQSIIPAPDEPGASTVQVPCKHHTKTPDSLNLIPLTLNPIPPTPPKKRGVPSGFTMDDIQFIDEVWINYPNRFDAGGERQTKGNKAKAMARIKDAMSRHRLTREDVLAIQADYAKSPNVLKGFIQLVETFWGEGGHWFGCWTNVVHERSKAQ